MKGYLESDRLVHDNALWTRQRQDLSALLRTRTAEEWDKLATQMLLPLTRIRTSAEWMASKHAQDAGIVVPVDDPEYGRMLQPGPSVRLLDSTSAVPLPRSRLGRSAEQTCSPPSVPGSSVRTRALAVSHRHWKVLESWTRRKSAGGTNRGEDTR